MYFKFKVKRKPKKKFLSREELTFLIFVLFGVQILDRYSKREKRRGGTNEFRYGKANPSNMRKR